MAQITVAIPTFKRPLELRACLTSLASSREIPGDLLVVDNDPAGSARGVIDSFADRLSIRYVIESRVGLAHVRNRILDESREADAVIFLDDDMVVRQDWLPSFSALHEVLPTSILAGVVAYWLPRHVTDPAVAAAASAPFEPSPHPIRLEMTGAGNTLIPTAVVHASDVRFDEEFNHLGGEDTDFVGRLLDSGVEIWLCPGAQVEERFGPKRENRTGVALRAIDGGEIRGRIRLRQDGWAAVFAGGMGRLAVGTAIGLFQCLARRNVWPQNFYLALSGVGHLRALRPNRSGRYGE